MGGRGHATVLLDILRQEQHHILALISLTEVVPVGLFADIVQYYDNDDVLRFNKDQICLVNGVGSLPGQGVRFGLFERFTSLGYQFESVIACSAQVSLYARLGHGVQILPGAIVQAGAVIGDNTIINTGAIIEHDCIIGRHNHVAPGVTLSGGVKTADYVHIGTGASVVQNVEIKEDVIIGAGCVVTRDVPAKHTVYPARTTMMEHKVK